MPGPAAPSHYASTAAASASIGLSGSPAARASLATALLSLVVTLVRLPARAQDVDVLGSWRATSPCMDTAHFPACKKVVDGVREFRGEFDFRRVADSSWVADYRNPRVRIRIAPRVRGARMTAGSERDMLPLALTMPVDSGSCPGLPLKPGTSWTYRAAVAWDAGGSDRVRRQTVSWTTTVVSVLASDSAVAATVQGWPTDLAWWEPQRSPTTAVIYGAGARVYLFHSPADSAQALAASLLSGAQRAGVDDLILELPLRTGHLYGRDMAGRHDTFYAWFVESADSVPSTVRRLRSGLGDSLYTVIYRSNPDHTILGFVPGLGVAHYVYVHHGTVAEADAWLVAYKEGRP